MEDGYDISLVCFNCGKKTNITINRPITFAFELASLANEVGMYGAIDHYYDRALVFCNEECAKNQITKSGHFRLRPKTK